MEKKRNYIFEINAFERWLEVNRLSSNAQLLWYKLMYLNSRSGTKEAWQEWISVDNYRLMGFMGIGEKALINARQQLIDSGLIEVKKGKKSFPNKYKILSFYCQNDGTNDSENDSINGGENAVKTTDINKHKQKQNNLREINKENPPPIKPVSFDCAKFLEAYNSSVDTLPKVTKLTEKRKKALMSLLTKLSEEDVLRLFKLAQESDFLSGKNERGWTCNFDWLINYNNAVKVLEGHYVNRTGQARPQSRFVNYDQRSIDASKMREYEKMILEKELKNIRNKNE